MSTDVDLYRGYRCIRDLNHCLNLSTRRYCAVTFTYISTLLTVSPSRSCSGSFWTEAGTGGYISKSRLPLYRDPSCCSGLSSIYGATTFTHTSMMIPMLLSRCVDANFCLEAGVTRSGSKCWLPLPSRTQLHLNYSDCISCYCHDSQRYHDVGVAAKDVSPYTCDLVHVSSIIDWNADCSCQREFK